MTLFRPRIGKKYVKGGNRSVGDHIRKHRSRIAFDDAEIFQTAIADFAEQLSDAGLMYFDADIIFIGIVRSDFRRRASHAETDFDRNRFFVSEKSCVIDKRFPVRNAPFRGKLRVIALLRRGHARRPHDIGFYVSERPLFFKYARLVQSAHSPLAGEISGRSIKGIKHSTDLSAFEKQSRMREAFSISRHTSSSDFHSLLRASK